MKCMIRIVALLIAALMLVTSCQAPDSGSQLTSETVDVSFAGPSARTITTDDGLVQTVATSNLYFQYKAVWQGSGDPPSTATNEWTSLSGPGLSSTVKLHRGTWELSLRAFVNQSDVGEDDKFILSGTLPRVEIGANNLVTQTVSINLGYVRQEGNGTLHVSVTYPVVYHEAANPESSFVEAVRKVKVTANVAGTDYTGNITTFNAENVGTLDLTVPAGAAHVTVQYYMDDSTLFEDDQTSKDVLIMATMTTNLAVSVDRDITAVTFTAGQPTGTVEDNIIPKVFNSIFDIYPDNIANNAIVIGYAKETKSLDQTPITYPYEIVTTAEPDAQGRYTASSLGLTPIVVTSRDALNSSAATEAWYGKSVSYSSGPNTTLTTVKFVDGVTSIGDFAFQGCTGLTSVTIPDGVTSIGYQAFQECTSLTNITIPSSVTSIGYQSFADCTGLTNVTIPNSVTSIGMWAFGCCTSLTSIAIPDSVTSIELNTFAGCTSLTSVTIPDSVTSIGEYAFNGCSGLTSITIPDSVTSIGNQSFRGCTGLTSVTIPDSVTSIGEAAFCLCSGLTSVVIPESVTKIERAAFEACGLTSITIPSSVTSIDTEAFYSCTSLTSVTIPDSVTSIGNQSFQKCTSLTNITIPSSVTSIGFESFADCTSLTDIYVNQAESSLLNNTGYPSGTCTIHWNSTGSESV